MSLGHYQHAFRAIAEEALHNADRATRRTAVALIRADGPLAGLAHLDAAERDDLTRMLGLAPKAYQQAWSALPSEIRPAYLAGILFLALRSASTIGEAETCQSAIGMGYRKALRYVSEQFLQNPPGPSTDDLLAMLR